MSGDKRGTVERTKGYLTKPSTHFGVYAAGWGALIGGSGGLVKGAYDALYAEGPLIIADALRGSWQDAAYHLGVAAGRAFATSAAFAEASAFVGYAGGSLMTERALGYASSFSRWIFGDSNHG
ncbi:MAG: hypothetical protein NT016_04230 [Candidatus Aenigmarchaeota archaeon]|nr:hypothetical protein [Candidatus Aenigmarchaeota archaeon]